MVRWIREYLGDARAGSFAADNDNHFYENYPKDFYVRSWAFGRGWNFWSF